MQLDVELESLPTQDVRAQQSRLAPAPQRGLQGVE